MQTHPEESCPTCMNGNSPASGPVELLRFSHDREEIRRLRIKLATLSHAAWIVVRPHELHDICLAYLERTLQRMQVCSHCHTPGCTEEFHEGEGEGWKEEGDSCD